MRVPEQRPLLLEQGELVGEALPSLDRALGDVGRPVRPARQPLPHSMPTMHRWRGRHD